MLYTVKFWHHFGTFFPSPLILINNDGDIIHKNNIFNDLIRLDCAKLFSFIEPKCLIKINEYMMQAQKSKTILSHTIKVKKSSSEIFYLLYYLIPLDDGSFALLFIDNTNANNEIMMLNNIINTAPDPIFVKNDQHQFMYVNQAFTESLGLSAPQILGKSDIDFFPKTESDIFYKVDRKTFKTGKTTINEETFTSKIGVRIISTKKSVFRTLTGRKILVGVIRDVTELNEVRECLKKHAKELKRQVDLRTRQLEIKRTDLENVVEKLKSLNSDLDCFAHICCHELREPLRTICTFSKLVLDEYARGDIQDVGNFLRIIHQGASKMGELIRSILEYSTNGLRTNSMSLFSANDVMTEVLNMLFAQIQEKKAIVIFNELPHIYADRLQILQLFQNLINNSIKFCKTTIPPIINICAYPKNKFIEFHIADNGIGIAKKYHKEIFLPFKKFHSRSEGSSYGIGLSLCKKIIENHGGSIRMSSQEAVGTTFRFLLPTETLNLMKENI